MSGLSEQLTKSSIVWKFAATAGGTTLAIWTPATSTRISLTGLDISNFGVTTGTVHVFFSTSTATRGNTVGMYMLGSTATIEPVRSFRFPGLESRMDVPLNVVSSGVGVNVTAIGVELQ